MAAIKVSRALGSAIVVAGVGVVDMVVDGAAVEDGAVGMGMECAAETPGTLSDIPDTRVLCVLRRKNEWEGGGRGEGSRRERARDAVLLTGVATGGKGCERGAPGSERDKLYLWLILSFLERGFLYIIS